MAEIYLSKENIQSRRGIVFVVGKMFVVLICILTLQKVHTTCVQQDICPENTTVQAEIVDAHNAIRRDVDPSAADMLLMTYSEELGVSAQAWLDKCILEHGPPSTRMFNGYELGENLYFSSSAAPWSSVISAWQHEKWHYAYPNGSAIGLPIGHYTQVVWNSSYRVGCGLTLCPNSTYFYGCHYFRAGNFRRWPPYKVGNPCASCPNNCVDKLCTNPCPYINDVINCPALINEFGCNSSLVSGWCPASCKCTTEIIPIY
ncbi:cysteine-rich venom protein [Austrofundulus limnaeus]|uniref:Cysteine-rich venom protein n=1 Tax=Austrofundulus limnaeus TaxID=52670 RepID=A0A2I4BVU2_AUSLI|nr:PREDICTED: cysteine-rich venom protein-like [Austrofundulus limnaeus]